MSGGGSYQSTSLSSSHSKSFDSSEGLSHSGTFSSPEIEAKLSSGTLGSSSSRSKGSETSWRNSEFTLKTLGSLENVPGLGEGPLDVINAIDVAQQEEQLPFIADGDEVFISVSVHGIQISLLHPRIVILRIPLHEIERLVSYDDGLCGNTILVIKVIDADKSKNTCSLWIYQCPSEEAGQKIIQSFSHVLANVLSTQTANSDVTLELKDERSSIFSTTTEHQPVFLANPEKLVIVCTEPPARKDKRDMQSGERSY